MKLTKRQIQRIKTAQKRARRAESIFSGETNMLARTIIEITGVDGYVDYLDGDGFGFTPVSNNDTHITIDKLIQLADDGEDITEDVILDNLSI